MYLSRELTDYSLPRIGKEFGVGRKMLYQDNELHRTIEVLINKIKLKDQDE